MPFLEFLLDFFFFFSLLISNIRNFIKKKPTKYTGSAL